MVFRVPRLRESRIEKGYFKKAISGGPPIFFKIPESEADLMSKLYSSGRKNSAYDDYFSMIFTKHEDFSNYLDMIWVSISSFAGNKYSIGVLADWDGSFCYGDILKQGRKGPYRKPKRNYFKHKDIMRRNTELVLKNQNFRENLMNFLEQNPELKLEMLHPTLREYLGLPIE